MRTLAKVLPRQSVSSAISRSICSDGFIGSPRFESGRWTEKPAARQWLRRRPYSSSNSSSSSTLFLCRCAAILLSAERSRHVRLARSIGIAPGRARGDLLARHRGRLADQAPRGAAHQIDVDVIVVIDVGARRQHGGELLAGGGLHVVQKALLFRQPLPAVLDRNVPSVGEREARDVERVAEGVLGNMRIGIAVHAAAGIGGDLPDLDDARAEPAHRCRLHGIGEPAVEHRDDRTGQRRRRLDGDRPEGA